MNRAGANKKYLDATIAFTTSSKQYKEPFRPSGSLFYKTQNKIKSFVSLRMIENCFVDFQTYRVNE